MFSRSRCTRNREKFMGKIHVLLLAAGGSSRMGQPKPLLPWGKKNLLDHQVDILKQLGCPIAVVLGSAAEAIRGQCDFSEIEVIENPDWKKGMGTSIAVGVSAIAKSHPDFLGILIALVDQPLVGIDHFSNMVQAFEPEKENIIVSQDRAGQWSPPVLFDKKYSPELIGLSGDHGAMPVVRMHSDCVKLVQCQGSLEDVDTPERYLELLGV